MAYKDLNPRKVGVRVTCAYCGYQKKPIGRSAPMAGVWCDEECRGYRLTPFVGSLWPNESEAGFGYAVGDVGTRIFRMTAPLLGEQVGMLGEFSNVKISLSEHRALRSRFGDAVTDEYIERLSCWRKDNPRKKGACDYARLLNWIRKDATVQAHTRPHEPKSPLLVEAEIMERVNAIIREQEKRRTIWDVEYKHHAHGRDCGFGGCCKYADFKRPVVRDAEELKREIMGIEAIRGIL